MAISRKTSLVGALLSLAFLAGGGWAFFQGAPNLANVFAPPPGSDAPGTYYVSATWRGEFKNYKSYVLAVPKKSVPGSKPAEFDDYARTVSKFSFPEGYIVQEFCEFENRRFVVWGKFWTSPDALWTGRIYELTNENGSIVPRLVEKTSDYRFRDCSFGTAFGKTVMGSVTQGDGYFHLFNATDGASDVRHVPYYGKSNNKVTTMHFVDFADLDGDGNDEAYLTATTPEFWRFWNSTGYAEGTLFRADIGPDGKIGKIDDVGWLEESFVKRVKTISVNGKDVVLVGIEGQLTEDGKSKTPFRIEAYYGSENGKPKHRNVLEVQNKECKEFATYSPLGKTVPSFQLGCDNGETYVYEITGTSPEDFGFAQKAKIELNQKIDEKYASMRDALYFWDIVQTHSLFGDDIDSDGKDELLIWVNNTGLYRAKINEDGTVDTSEIFHIKRVFPEPVGRLMIFAITDDPTGNGFANSPLIPYVQKENTDSTK